MRLEIEPAELLRLIDDAINANDSDDRWDRSESSPWRGHADSTDIAQQLIAGRSRQEAWVDYLVSGGFAPSRERWRDWALLAGPWENYKRIRDGFEFPRTYEYEPAIVGALVRLRRSTGYVARDDYGWTITPEGDEFLAEQERDEGGTAWVDAYFADVRAHAESQLRRRDHASRERFS